MILNTKTKYFSYFTLSFVICALFSSCVIDDTTPNPIEAHNYTSYDALFKDSIYQVQTLTIDAASAVDLNSLFNTNLNLPEGTIQKTNGDAASGAAEIQFIELRKKSDLLMSGLSLVRNDGTLLELAGGFSLTIWQNQQQLDFDGTLEIDFDDPGGLSSNGDLEVFYNGTDSSAPVEEATDQSAVALVGDRYELTGGRIGWVLAAQDFVSNNGTTSLTLNSNLDETTVMDQRAFVLFNDFRGVVRLPKNGDSFSLIGLPIGQSATVVMTAFDEQKFYIATKEITISENETLDMFLQGYPLVDFVTLIKGLD